MSAQEPETFSGILSSPLNKSSNGLAYHYLFPFKKPTVCPPNITLVPGQEYKMLVYGDKIAILDPTNPYYEKTLTFFQNYVGDYTRTTEFVNLSDNTGGSGKVGACFVDGTQVTLTDGSTKNIEDIQVDDLVLSYNKNRSELESKRALPVSKSNL